VSEPTDKWSAPGSGDHYAGPRFATARAAGRDPRTLARLLERHGVRGPILDAPCGTGRLSSTLARFGQRVVSLDLSASMLASARERLPGAALQASVSALPFRERSFDVVVSCRFLHHLQEREARRVALRELLRASDRLVVASFWDSASWPALRVRLGLRRSEGPRGRTACSRAELEELVADGGARVLEYATSLRFLSQQTFFVAERVR
jgi:SAM-dependent methyltransferase